MCLHCFFSSIVHGNTSSLIFLLIIITPPILTYFFSSLAFFRLMKSRNLKWAFLAWIPLLDVYAIGKVCDDINKTSNKKTYFGITLPIVNSLFFIFYLILVSYNFHIVSLYFVILGLLFAILIIKLMCFSRILDAYSPDNLIYLVLTVIFSVIPIVPFIPSLCLWRASKNRPISLLV